MTDPWVVRSGGKTENSVLTVDLETANSSEDGFEDNFTSATASDNRTGSLPDSLQYLESLEKKLKRLKRDPNILRQLAAKREECIGSLLNDDLFIDRDGDLALAAPINGGESAVHEIYRHLRPMQPLNVGETVNIVQYDQLEEQQRAQEETSSEESESASR